ncbi:MAG: hypothetical protein K8S54_10460 [Spirochaetia bacterium]|nr:hypothetical protein [Spirochaetia bacterium]
MRLFLKTVLIVVGAPFVFVCGLSVLLGASDQNLAAGPFVTLALLFIATLVGFFFALHMLRPSSDQKTVWSRLANLISVSRQRMQRELPISSALSPRRLNGQQSIEILRREWVCNKVEMKPGESISVPTSCTTILGFGEKPGIRFGKDSDVLPLLAYLLGVDVAGNPIQAGFSFYQGLGQANLLPNFDQVIGRKWIAFDPMFEAIRRAFLADDSSDLLFHLIQACERLDNIADPYIRSVGARIVSTFGFSLDSSDFRLLQDKKMHQLMVQHLQSLIENDDADAKHLLFSIRALHFTMHGCDGYMPEYFIDLRLRSVVPELDSRLRRRRYEQHFAEWPGGWKGLDAANRDIEFHNWGVRALRQKTMTRLTEIRNELATEVHHISEHKPLNLLFRFGP